MRLVVDYGDMLEDVLLALIVWKLANVGALVLMMMFGIGMQWVDVSIKMKLQWMCPVFFILKKISPREISLFKNVLKLLKAGILPGIRNTPWNNPSKNLAPNMKIYISPHSMYAVSFNREKAGKSHPKYSYCRCGNRALDIS
jgi:hypothetical protein